MLLTGLIAALLFVPRLLGLLLIVASPAQRRLVGGAFRATLSTLFEILASILLEVERAFGLPFFDPTRGGDPLLWQHLFWLFGHPVVYEVFSGKDGGWNNQTRDDGATLPFSLAFAATRAQFFIGILAAGILAVLPSGLAWWFSPIVIGLLLAPITLWIGSSPGLGQAARRLGLFLIPEESAPPRIIRRANELAKHPLVAMPDGGPQALLRDRLPRYQALADNFGYTIEASDLARITSGEEFVELMGQAIGNRGRM